MAQGYDQYTQDDLNAGIAASQAQLDAARQAQIDSYAATLAAQEEQAKNSSLYPGSNEYGPLFSTTPTNGVKMPKGADVTVTTQRLAPYQEQFQKDILQSTSRLTDTPIQTPDQLVAGIDPLTQAAYSMGTAGIGGYQPMLQNAQDQAAAAVSAGAEAQGSYDPATMTQAYMDPYQQQVIDATLADISRSGEMERQQLNDSAIAAGAFGGSRDALLQAEQYRGQMKQMADTSAQMRSAGYLQAQQAGMGAFEAARQRDLAAAGTLSNLGSQYANLATQGQAQYGQDVATLQGLGGMRQAQEQAQLDAQRATELERLYEPYKRVGFMADIFAGTPTSQQTMTAAPPAPVPSSSSQYIGLGLAGLGALGQMYNSNNRKN